MEHIKLINFIAYFLIVFSSNLICTGLYADESQQYIYQDTESPETTTEKYAYNITLDVANDITREWQISRMWKNWFEYYNDTDSIKKVDAAETCAHVIVTSISQLSEVNGIWGACQDPLLPKDCSQSITPSAACHPYIAYSVGSHTLPFRTVKINLYLSGLAIVRLTPGVSTIGGWSGRCFDFSIRRDPFSSCEYIKVEVNSTTGWTQVKSTFSVYDNHYFKQFTIQLIARFKDDIALVDKVEATNFLLCGETDSLCTSTSPGPTRSSPTTEPTPVTTVDTTTEGDITDPWEDNTSTTTKGTKPPPSSAASLHVSLLLFPILVCYEVYKNVFVSTSV